MSINPTEARNDSFIKYSLGAYNMAQRNKQWGSRGVPATLFYQRDGTCFWKWKVNMIYQQVINSRKGIRLWRIWWGARLWVSRGALCEVNDRRFGEMTLLANRWILLVQSQEAKAQRPSQAVPLEVRNLDCVLNMIQFMSFKVHPVNRVEDDC